MTAIVGVVEKGEVWIGADSAISFGDYRVPRVEPKVFRVGAVLMGCAGSMRVLQLMRHAFKMPAHPATIGAMSYMVNDFVPAVRGCLRDGGSLGSDEGVDSTAGNSVLLLGYQGHLFYLDMDFNLYEPLHGFETTGSGAEVAMGCLWATRGQKPEKRVRRALEAAATFIPSVAAPFHIERL